MTTELALTTINGIDKAINVIPEIDNIPEARKKLTLAYHYTKALGDEYQAAKLSDATEDKAKIQEASYKLSIYRLLVEAQLGRLIEKEQQEGRLARVGGDGRNQYTEGTHSRMSTLKTLADYGLTWNDSSNAKKLMNNEDKIKDALNNKPQDEPLTRKQFIKSIRVEANNMNDNHLSKEQLAQAIKSKRDKNQLSQNELAFLLGVSRQIIGDWEIGRRYPSSSNLKKVMEWLEFNHEQETLRMIESLKNILNEAEVCLRYFQNGQTGKRLIFRKNVNVNDINYLIASMEALFDEDKFQRWKAFTNYEFQNFAGGKTNA